MTQTAIAIFGGTFDPPHLGHKTIVTYALKQLGVRLVLCVPCGTAVHKTLVTPFAIRYQQLQALFTDLAKHCTISTYEYTSGNAYSATTLAYFARHFWNQKRLFLLGKDAYCDLPNWRNWRSITDHAHLVVFNRAHKKCVSDQLQSFTKQRLLSKSALIACEQRFGGVCFIDDFAVAVSSSALRASAAQGQYQPQTEAITNNR